MSSMLHEFHNAQGTAPAGEAHGLRRGCGLPAAGPSRIQIQQSPSPSQGLEGRGQGGRAPSFNGRGRRAQRSGGNGQQRQVLALAAEPRAQVCPPAHDRAG
jgi:hypothetical protein